MCEFHAMTPGGVRLERQRQVYAARSGFGDRKDVGNAEAVAIDVDGMHGQRSEVRDQAVIRCLVGDGG